MYYIENGESFPQPLTEEEEQFYLQQMWEGNQEARNILIVKNLRLVAHVAKKYSSTYANVYDDIISVGTIGLIKAIESYTKMKNTKLSTFAAKCIENEILMFLRQNKKFSAQVSIYDSIGTDKDGNEITLMDVLQNQEVDVDENVDVKMQIKKLIGRISKILKNREKKVIAMRYGLSGYDEKTQMEVAQELGISRSYVSRIEKKALKKLFNELVK